VVAADTEIIGAVAVGHGTTFENNEYVPEKFR